MSVERAADRGLLSVLPIHREIWRQGRSAAAAGSAGKSADVSLEKAWSQTPAAERDSVRQVARSGSATPFGRRTRNATHSPPTGIVMALSTPVPTQPPVPRPFSTVPLSQTQPSGQV